MTLTCTTSPAGVATSYRWLLDGRLVSTDSVYEISSAQPSHDGSYVCEASNDFGQADTSNTPLAMSVSCEYASSCDYVFVLIKPTLGKSAEVHRFRLFFIPSVYNDASSKKNVKVNRFIMYLQFLTTSFQRRLQKSTDLLYTYSF